MMIYYICAVMTFISASVSLGFSLVAYKQATTESLTNAMYAFSRSFALWIGAVIPFFYHTVAYLYMIAIAMILVQFFDGLIGVKIKNRLKTFGPFVTAAANLVCLILLFI